MSNDKRMYGFFTCPRCEREWESSWAWCYRKTNKPSSGQQCQNRRCPKTYIKPYHVERLKCSICGSVSGSDSDSDSGRCTCHVDNDDPAKPHRSDLCERCIRGSRCQYLQKKKKHLKKKNLL